MPVLMFIFIAWTVLLSMGLSSAMGEEVVVYTSLDQVFSQPILGTFERETGIRVRPLYDVEASKTVGLVNRLIAEKRRPRADVFWNSEVIRTIQLVEKGVIAPYRSPFWDGFPEKMKDKTYHWTGFAARARVLIYNTRMLTKEQLPVSIFDLTDLQWKGRVTIGYPLFGTTATHVAALYAAIGPEGTEAYLKKLLENRVIVVDGNSMTRDLVVDGKAAVGFTDTDDAHVAISKGEKVDMFFPDRNGIGALLIPNTVALIKGGPNPEPGKRLIDYLLSEKVESALSFAPSRQMPLRSGVKRPSDVVDISNIKAMAIDYLDVFKYLERSSRFCQEFFIR